MKPTKVQQLQWLKEKKCHVCGKDTPHSHPNWMWLANPAPDSSDPDIQERIQFEDKANALTLKVITG